MQVFNLSKFEKTNHNSVSASRLEVKELEVYRYWSGFKVKLASRCLGQDQTTGNIDPLPPAACLSQDSPSVKVVCAVQELELIFGHPRRQK